MDTDLVNKPPHYTNGKVECLEYLEDNMSIVGYCGFLEGNVKKYLHRYRYKGTVMSDLNKAKFYLNRLIEVMEGVDHGEDARDGDY